MRSDELCNMAYRAGLSEFGRIRYSNKYPENVLMYHWPDQEWTADCLGFVHTLVNGTVFNKDQLGGGAVMDDFVNYSDEQTTLNKYCHDVSGDFKTIKPGELLYMSGHVGLYIGEHVPFSDGRKFNVAECCYQSFGGGGMLTWVDPDGCRRNHSGGTSAGYWTRHGQFTRVEYVDFKPSVPDTPKFPEPAEILNIVNDTFVGIYGNNPERERLLTEAYGYAVYRQVQDILNILYRNA